MIKLALIDNGIPYHMRNNRNQRIVHKSFLASKCDPSEYKDDKSFHGAVCVGIITSICSDIELWDLNVTDSAGTTQITVLLEALEWCIQNKIKLIHMSLGTINYFDIKPLWIQIKRLLDADAIIVAAYHNRNIKTYPAAYPGVFGVRQDRYGLLGNGQILFQEQKGYNIENSIIANFSWNGIVNQANSYAAPVVTGHIATYLNRKPTAGFDDVMDFIDDPPEISEQERFQRHNRFLRSLKSDTLLIIDNFNVTSTQDSCLSVVLKYRCRVLFTTRSQLSEYCSFQLKELKDIPTLFQLTSVFYSEAEENRAIVEKIIETVHYHTFAVELAAKLLENGILTPEQLLIKLQEEKASLHNEDKIKVMKDGQSKKATYYNHIHTLFSLYSLSRKQQDIMCNMCFMPSSGISARIFSKWLELPTLNDVNDLIETGFVQSSLRHTISLHPMIQEIAVSETAPSVTSCHTLLDSLQKICLMHGIEVSYYKKLFQTVENIMLFIEKDDIPQYLLFLEDVFPYMEKYHYQKGMKKIIQELQHFIKANTYGTASDRALLLDYQATLEPKTEKAIKLEKEALAQIKETTKENAHLVSNLHSNLGGLYRINGQLDLAKRHMKMGISLLQQYQLLYTNDSIPQINNYAVLLIEIQEPDLALSALQKLAQIIKEYNSNHCLDYAQVQESLGSICLITANISQAKTHFKKALKIYEDIWADEPELIEEKYQAIQELYPQAGIALAKSILLTKH